jgi:hypothetical protein
VSLLATYLDPMEFSFDIVIVGENLADLQEKTKILIRAFSPLDGLGNLMFEYENGSKYWRRCMGNGAPELTGMRTQTAQEATIPLIAHDPFWYGPTELINISGGATSWIPWFAGDWKISGWGGVGSVINLGNHPVSCKIKIYGGAGEIVNPKITKISTGEFIKINKTLYPDEVFSVDTGDNVPVAAEYIDALGDHHNGFPYLSTDSVFFALDGGEDDIRLTADTATSGGYATIEKADKYVGA